MADDPSIAEIADRLYGLPLTEFTPARDAESRARKDAGDAALAGRVKRFKKPGAGAHLVNLLVRDDSALLDEIRDLGSLLRAAQADPDPARLRALDQERRSVVARSVSAVAAIADRDGIRATDASLRDVEQTVWAAVVDPGGFATMQAGLLIRPLSPSGFGAVDLADASALPVDLDDVTPVPPRSTTKKRPALAVVPEPAPSKPDPTAQRAHRKAVSAARAEVEAAENELHSAEQSLAESSRLAEESVQQLTDLQAELTRLREQIAAVEEEIHDLRSQQTGGKAAIRAAEKARRSAAAEVERARTRLDQLPSAP